MKSGELGLITKQNRLVPGMLLHLQVSSGQKNVSATAKLNCQTTVTKSYAQVGL